MYSTTTAKVSMISIRNMDLKVLPNAPTNMLAPLCAALPMLLISGYVDFSFG